MDGEPEMVTCECVGTELVDCVRRDRCVVLSTNWSQLMGHEVAKVARRDCPECHGTGQVDGRIQQRRERLEEKAEELLETCKAFARWFDGWCPTAACCARSGLPIHERAVALIGDIEGRERGDV